MKKLKQQLEDLRLALDEIVNPVEYLKTRAEKEGAKINSYAFELSKDSDYLKGIAKKALSKLNTENLEKNKNDLNTAKDFFIKNNFDYFSPEQLNVIGKTMIEYVNFIQAE